MFSVAARTVLLALTIYMFSVAANRRALPPTPNGYRKGPTIVPGPHPATNSLVVLVGARFYT